jgi:hypothetical protein
MSFSFLLQNQRTKRTYSRSCLFAGKGVGASGRGSRWVKNVGGRIWYKYCVHLNVNRKMILVETIPGMGVREDKGKYQRE